MNRFKYGVAVLGSLYVLYALKSAAGINISQRYHAIDIVKVPVKQVLAKLPMAPLKSDCGCNAPAHF
jgi:hypothetical protein